MAISNLNIDHFIWSYKFWLKITDQHNVKNGFKDHGKPKKEMSVSDALVTVSDIETRNDLLK